MIKIPISTKTFPLFMGSVGAVLIVMGFGQMALYGTVNSVSASISSFLGNPASVIFADMTVPESFVSYGTWFVIGGFVTYLAPLAISYIRR